MKKITVRQIINIVAIIATITVNALANALPINGKNTGEISDNFPVYFVPAGYVFSIWGLIYLALIGFAIYQALPAQKDNPHLAKIGYLFALTCVANIIWIFLWHYEQFPLTLIMMITLLLSLIAIYLRLNIGRTTVSTATKWFIHIPFSIYLGWVTVATIANVTTVLYYINWSGWGISEPIWAVIMLVIATGIAFIMSLTRADVAYLLVIIWAFIGIAIKQSATESVSIAAWVTASIVAMMLIAAIVIKYQRGEPALSLL